MEQRKKETKIAQVGTYTTNLEPGRIWFLVCIKCSEFRKLTHTIQAFLRRLGEPQELGPTVPRYLFFLVSVLQDQFASINSWVQQSQRGVQRKEKKKPKPPTPPGKTSKHVVKPVLWIRFHNIFTDADPLNIFKCHH